MITSDNRTIKVTENIGSTDVNPPIIISGNGALDIEPAVSGGPGNSYADAYIIENYEIDAVVEAGIYIENTDKYINISNCVIITAANHPGIELLGCSNITIFNCTIKNRANAIQIATSNNITIYECLCTDNFIGIYLTGSNNITVINNICNDSVLYGIQIESGSDNFVSKNHCHNNEAGIRLGAGSSFNQICFNFVWGNQIAGIQDSGINNNVYDNILTPPDGFDWILFAVIVSIGAIAGTGGALLVVKTKKKASGKVCVDTPKPQVPTGSKPVGPTPCGHEAGPDPPDLPICVDPGDNKQDPSKAKPDPEFKAGHIVKPVSVPPKGATGEKPAQKTGKSKQKAETNKDKKEK